ALWNRPGPLSSRTSRRCGRTVEHQVSTGRSRQAHEWQAAGEPLVGRSGALENRRGRGSNQDRRDVSSRRQRCCESSHQQRGKQYCGAARSVGDTSRSYLERMEALRRSPRTAISARNLLIWGCGQKSAAGLQVYLTALAQRIGIPPSNTERSPQG